MPPTEKDTRWGKGGVSIRNFACGEDSHALRFLRAANADRIPRGARGTGDVGWHLQQKRTPDGCPFLLEAPPGIGPGMKVLQTSALPLGYGAVCCRNCTALLEKTGYENLDFRTRLWSGLRGSNPPPPPWQGGALPNELNPHNGASGRNRTNDTGIFSPLLYQLSYRGIQQGDCCPIMAIRMGVEPTTSSVTG